MYLLQAITRTKCDRCKEADMERAKVSADERRVLCAAHQPCQMSSQCFTARCTFLHWLIVLPVLQGLIPIVGAAREPGTSMLIEDVACPVDKLADMMLDLVEMFEVSSQSTR